MKQILRSLGNGDGAQKPLPKVELAALSTAASITAREQQVLRLVSAGLSNREIAAQFSCAESTVKTHLKNIYRKLGVNSRTRAIAQAIDTTGSMDFFGSIEPTHHNMTLHRRKSNAIHTHQRALQAGGRNTGWRLGPLFGE